MEYIQMSFLYTASPFGTTTPIFLKTEKFPRKKTFREKPTQMQTT